MTNTVAYWHREHHSEGSIKERHEVSLGEKQVKLVTYFKSLTDSYFRAKQLRKVSDEEMVVTIRQMEVTLHLLGR